MKPEIGAKVKYKKYGGPHANSDRKSLEARGFVILFGKKEYRLIILSRKSDLLHDPPPERVLLAHLRQHDL